MKVCAKCGRELPEEMFHKNKRAKDGLTTQCKECRCKDKRIYDSEHRQEKKEYAKKYYEERREEITEYGKQYYQEHREEALEYKKRYREEHKNKIAEYSKKYQKTPKGKVAMKVANHRQRLKKKHSDRHFTADEWIALCAEFNNRCAYCGSEVPFVDALTPDHVVPIVDGGTNDIDNIVPACMYCNLTKNRRTLTDWYSEQPFFTAERYQKIIEHAHLK